jgi:hypothetical protein
MIPLTTEDVDGKDEINNLIEYINNNVQLSDEQSKRIGELIGDIVNTLKDEKDMRLYDEKEESY